MCLIARGRALQTACLMPRILWKDRTVRRFILPSVSARKSYRDVGVFGYSPEQIFAVVADVDRYHEFVPMCMGSTVLDSSRRQEGASKSFQAELVVGYPPFQERYTSQVRLDEPWRIEAIAVPNNGVFRYMKTVWELSQPSDSQNAPSNPFLKSRQQRQETTVSFSIDFEFKSALHAQAASLAFEKIAKSTLTAYRTRCQQLYGSCV